MGLAVTATAAPAHAVDPATLDLDYTCTFPLINQQPLHVHIAVGLPATVDAGVPTPPFDVNAIATVSANTTSGLALVGGKTIEGSAISHVNLQAPSVNLPDLQVPVTIAKTDVPASGTFNVAAVGQTPSVTFPAPGTGTIDVGGLNMRMTVRDANGQPIALPGGNADGSFNAPCTVDAGQSTRLASFDITGTPPANTPPTAAPATASTTASAPVAVTLPGSDPDGDALTYTVGTPANGTVSVVGNKATYKPKAGWIGTDNFTYTVSDGAAQDTNTVTVKVGKAPTTTKATPSATKVKIGKSFKVKVKVVSKTGALIPVGAVKLAFKSLVLAKGSLSGGAAVLTVPSTLSKKLPKGKDTFVATYLGNAYTTGSSAKVVITMVK
ncbi:DUF6801 domain-containing protein [Nocardioides ultimimeridianus]